jgi:hypothetical protein
LNKRTRLRQVGERNIGASRYTSIGRRKWRSMFRPNITEDSAAGKQSGDILAAVADVEQRAACGAPIAVLDGRAVSPARSTASTWSC